jgi:hypothetical protein
VVVAVAAADEVVVVVVEADAEAMARMQAAEEHGRIQLGRTTPQHKFTPLNSSPSSSHNSNSCLSRTAGNLILGAARRLLPQHKRAGDRRSSTTKDGNAVSSAVRTNTWQPAVQKARVRERTGRAKARHCRRRTRQLSHPVLASTTPPADGSQWAQHQSLFSQI